MARWTSPRHPRLALASVLLALALAILGCSVGGTTGGSSTSSTPGGPTVTPTPPPHALAWFQVDGSGVGQIWASVNGGAPHQVTHMAAPSGDCVRDQHWSPPVFSPNLSRIVGGWGSGACGDGPEQGDLYVVDASSGAATPIHGPTYPGNIRLSLRQAGWIDNNTIWWIDFTSVYTYTLGAATGTQIGTIGSTSGSSYTGADDAVLRGNTLFYVTYSGSSGASTTTFALRRFDMTTHAVLPGAVDLGSARNCQCSMNDRSNPGFDVSRDGARIVYQRTAPSASLSGGGEGVASSQFFSAAADGSGASRIASYATSSSFARMQLSPNGRLVAVARALSSPSVFTASVSSPGNSGDPDLHFYNPDGFSYPVWKWDGSQFWASTSEIPSVYPPTTGNVERFTLATPAGAVGVAGGSNPWYTIGS